MRSLKDIFTNLKADREILFEKGLWCIYRRLDGPVTPFRPVNGIYVIHRCVKVERSLNHGEWRCGNGQWHGCGKVAPEGIQALYILNGWDNNIQKEIS